LEASHEKVNVPEIRTRIARIKAGERDLYF
jgi:hypothetical protein